MSASPKPVLVDIVESALRELADSEYQRRVWVEGSTTEVSSMNEATAALFNDSGLDVALEQNRSGFSPEIEQELNRLRSMLRESLAAQAERGTSAVIASTEWTAVLRTADQLLKKIAGRQ